MEQTEIEKIIEDIAFLRDKAHDPLVAIAYNMAIEVCKVHLEKLCQSPSK